MTDSRIALLVGALIGACIGTALYLILFKSKFSARSILYCDPQSTAFFEKRSERDRQALFILIFSPRELSYSDRQALLKAAADAPGEVKRAILALVQE